MATARWSLGPRIPPRPNLRETVYQTLRRQLVELATTTSTSVRVSEIELARSLGVSRTPVREALTRLHQEGLVSLTPHRGVRVVPTSLEEYFAWLEVREALEGTAARLAARQPSEAGLARMHEILDPFRSATVPGSPETYARANAAFHAALVSESGNPVLRRIWQLYDHMQMIRFRVIDRLGRAEQSLQEHSAILQALERRDPRRAERLARRHVRLLREAALRRLKTLEPERRE